MSTNFIWILKNFFSKRCRVRVTQAEIAYHVLTIPSFFIAHVFLLFVWQSYFPKADKNDEDGFDPQINSNTSI